MITHEELQKLTEKYQSFADETWTHAARRINNGKGDHSFVVALGPDDEARLDFLTTLFNSLPGLLEAARTGIDAPKERTYTPDDIVLALTETARELIHSALAERLKAEPQKKQAY